MECWLNYEVRLHNALFIVWNYLWMYDFYTTKVHMNGIISNIDIEWGMGMDEGDREYVRKFDRIDYFLN